MDKAPTDSAEPKRPRGARSSVVVAGAVFIFAVLGISFYFMSLSPAAREAHRFFSEMPVDRIIEIRIEPYTVDSLTRHVVTVRDRNQIALIADQLRSASRVSPNHPQARWVAILRIVTDGREYGGQVESTSNQGVLVWYASQVEGGWNYGTYQQDSLGPVLEKIVSDSAIAQTPK